MQEISFNVPADFFDISGYKALSKFNWNKIKTAKVFYKGNLINDALVFRHDDYIFIHVAEFEHFLVDLQKKIADTVVFQGLLVAQNGSYIWRTNADEAISIGEPDGYIESDCNDCVKIQSELNFLAIPDPKNKSKTLVKITW